MSSNTFCLEQYQISKTQTNKKLQCVHCFFNANAGFLFLVEKIPHTIIKNTLTQFKASTAFNFLDTRISLIFFNLNQFFHSVIDKIPNYLIQFMHQLPKLILYLA